MKPKENGLHRISLPSKPRESDQWLETAGLKRDGNGDLYFEAAGPVLGKMAGTFADLMVNEALRDLSPKKYPQVLIAYDSFSQFKRDPRSHWGLILGALILGRAQMRTPPWRPQLVLVSPDPDPKKRPEGTPGPRNPEEAGQKRHFLVNGMRVTNRSVLREQVECDTAVVAADFVSAGGSLRHILKTLTENGVGSIRNICCWAMRDTYETVREAWTTPREISPEKTIPAIPGFCPPICAVMIQGANERASMISSGEIPVCKPEDPPAPPPESSPVASPATPTERPNRPLSPNWSNPEEEDRPEPPRLS